MIKKLYLKHKIFNHLMINGNKETCENIFLKSSKLLQKSLIKNNQEVIKIGIINSSPVVSVKQTRLKKGKKKTIKKYPFVLDLENRIALAIKFILETVKQKEKKSSYLYSNLKQEIEANSQSNGSAVKRKENLQKDALLNKKYAYYRWF
jgi:small subunit ribosomal protein S7